MQARNHLRSFNRVILEPDKRNFNAFIHVQRITMSFEWQMATKNIYLFGCASYIEIQNSNTYSKCLSERPAAEPVFLSGFSLEL